MKVRKFQKKPSYVYEVNQMEIKYKTLLLLRDEAGKKLKEDIEKNGHHCVCAVTKSPDTLCMCLEFRNRDSEGPCKCGLYTKTLRTEKEVEAWSKSNEPKYNEKKEAALLKKMEYEEKMQAKQREAWETEASTGE